ncbi:MAG: Gfo/Idh/MocA family oxidoreductase [Pirellulaceae bacterium]|nr:Gfo/Idh/MocA family oxidoreductase [Pirellulaceae bacterium]
MSNSNRRSFLKHTAAASAGAAAWAWTGGLHAAGANERLTVGIIGCGGRGAGLAEEFAGLANVAYVCDPDESRRRRAQEKVQAQHAVADLRRILDDKSVDAVVIATPEHWHAPAAILACDAGKHVYVEKPCSHNVREGRLLVEAARRNKRVVQHGTQSRSNPFIAGAIQMLREGVIGDVLVAKAWDIQRRANIGRDKPSDPPPGVDYDLWVGPAEFVPYQANRFHYHWHWWYNFGVGGLGGDGPHEIDYARWGLGVETHPTTVAGLGSKYYFDDDQEYPDTGTVVFEWPGDGQVGHKRQFIFELRIWSTNYPYNVDSGAEFYGTKGKMFLSKRGKLEILDEGNKRIDAKPKAPPQLLGHAADFLDAIKTGRHPNAEIEIGHLSTTLIHLGNLAMRVGRSLNFDPHTEQIIGDEQANALLSRKYRQGGHWAVPRGV